MEEAFGTVEVRGWAAAIAAADAGVKTAGVRVAGTDITKGGGQVVVRFAGEVSAVRAAVEAAAVAAGVSRVIATHVIPRPHPETARLLPGTLRARAGAKKNKGVD